METAKDKLPHGPLTGLRVIELGVLLAGPFSGQLMGDMGAEVIKVELPNQGDPIRKWGRELVNGQSLWWPVVARNKKSITLNLREQEGKDILLRLVKEADILVENFRPGTMEKWGLGYEKLKEVNKGIIMVRVSGFGQTGPYAPRAGYGSIGEAMGGLRYIVGEPDRPPSRMGISIGDSLAASYATMGALAALRAREITGEGQVIDTAIYESVLAMMESLVTEYYKTGYVRERTGSRLPNIAPSNVYPTRDGEILIGANQDTVFRRLADLMGQPELAEDPKYADHVSRGQNEVELDDIIGLWSRERASEDLLNRLHEAGIPAGKIFTAGDMLENEHFKHREALVKHHHPGVGDLMMQNVAPKLSATPGSIRTPAPELGQHNEEVYRQLLKISEEEYQEFVKKGIV
ncbi:MAG: CoA transferase [Cyclobacteriaceae bacterium]|nr:CoA transferase [Cyclobacteriaceae bacterium]MCH8516274.1 CoA transferase [Cyclobacteriaceae bacterium]